MHGCGERLGRCYSEEVESGDLVFCAGFAEGSHKDEKIHETDFDSV